ncbi:endonuclease/exonuclease/phosphatase family protein [Bacteroides sedimenti]
MRLIKCLMMIFCMTFVSCGKSDNNTPFDPGWGNGADDSPVEKVSIVTYNIRHCSAYIIGDTDGPIDVSGISRSLKSLQADVVFLQEVDKNTTRSGKDLDEAAKIAELAGFPYYHFYKAQDYQGGEYGLAILSRFNLTGIEQYDLPRVEVEGTYVGYSILAKAVVSINGKRIVLATTHLATTAENRVEQMPVINEKLSSIKDLVILGGDFNATPSNSTINTLDSYGFVRSGKDKNYYTIPSNAPNREIDYICFKPGDKVQIIEHKVFGEMTISDHLPVRVTFKMI